MLKKPYLCTQCHANWSSGQFTSKCSQCGGGALQRKCVLCNGRCGNVYHRATIDSWDSNEAHWVGNCGLSEEIKLKIIKQQIENADSH